MLHLGDCYNVMRGFKSNSVDLIYLDPPFNTGKDWGAFDDRWRNDQMPSTQLFRIIGIANSRSMANYIEYMRKRLQEMERVLKPDGSIYLHCDTRANSYLRIVMDHIFGQENFRNEIVWKRSGSHSFSGQFGKITDRILFYGSDINHEGGIRIPLSEEYIRKLSPKEDSRGRYISYRLTGAGVTKGECSQAWKGFNPADKGRHWAVPKAGYKGVYGTWIHNNIIPEYDKIHGVFDRLNILDKYDLIFWTKNNVPHLKRYLESHTGIMPNDLWSDINGYLPKDERKGYPTQKPLDLLYRIINASSNEGDTVLDPFCGSGTALIAAKDLGRKYIGIDVNESAIEIARKRLYE